MKIHFDLFEISKGQMKISVSIRVPENVFWGGQDFSVALLIGRYMILSCGIQSF